jgi:hypothetical protein
MARKDLFHDKNGVLNRHSLLGTFIGIGLAVIADMRIIGPILTAHNVDLNLIYPIIYVVPFIGAIIGGAVGKYMPERNYKTQGSFHP